MTKDYRLSTISDSMETRQVTVINSFYSFYLYFLLLSMFRRLVFTEEPPIAKIIQIWRSKFTSSFAQIFNVNRTVITTKREILSKAPFLYADVRVYKARCEKQRDFNWCSNRIVPRPIWLFFEYSFLYFRSFRFQKFSSSIGAPNAGSVYTRSKTVLQRRTIHSFRRKIKRHRFLWNLQTKVANNHQIEGIAISRIQKS